MLCVLPLSFLYFPLFFPLSFSVYISFFSVCLSVGCNCIFVLLDFSVAFLFLFFVMAWAKSCLHHPVLAVWQKLQCFVRRKLCSHMMEYKEEGTKESCQQLQIKKLKHTHTLKKKNCIYIYNYVCGCVKREKSIATLFWCFFLMVLKLQSVCIFIVFQLVPCVCCFDLAFLKLHFILLYMIEHVFENSQKTHRRNNIL